MNEQERVDEQDLRSYAAGLVRYDAMRKRVWIGSQRLHHGLTGALVTGTGVACLAAHRISPRGGLEWALAGSVLMAHDWHDRSHWFEKGPQKD
ncbi:MAG: hypothetical protein ACR2K6_07020 [Solirubrobacterales bacterium]